MSSTASPIVAVVLPPREGFGPRRARGIGLTVRHHALAIPNHRTIVFGGRQSGPVFLDVTYRRVIAPYFFPGAARARFTLGMLRPLRHERPDLIEVHGEPRIALWLQRVFPTVPVVLFVHDDPATAGSLRTPERRARVLARIARVVTVSEWLRDQFLRGMPPPDRPPLVVPPCVDLQALPATDYRAGGAEIPMAQRRTRLILFAGRLTPDKGVDLFVSACGAALPRLAGWRAEIIGATEHSVQSPDTPFMRLVHASADPMSIAMLGYRDHPDVMGAMARAAIVVIPSRVPEPGGRVAIEAMANGAAVICSSRGALPEVVANAAVLVDPENATELAATIRGLAEDPRNLAAWAEAARARAALFDIRVIGRWLETVRARVIAEGPRTG